MAYDAATGLVNQMDAETAGVLRRIFAAGGREAPIFETGETLSLRGGKFRVLAFGGPLLVLEGVPAGPDDLHEER